MTKSLSPMFEYSRTYKPFLYPWAVDLTVEHERMHWIEEEAELGEDITDWKVGTQLTAENRAFIKQILRMFTQSDVNVGRYYLDFLIPRFKNNEIRNMLVSFAAREGVHQRAYALLNDTLGFPDSEYAQFLEYEEMADKADFMMRADVSTDEGLALALAKSVFNEGVSLFASFAMLLSFQRRGLMKGMGKIVEWSTKDESKHVEGIARLFKQFCAEHPHVVTDEFKAKIYEMNKMIVHLEDLFIDLAYASGADENLEKQDVKNYIRFVANRRLNQLGLKAIWDVEKNPLEWIDYVLNGADHTNFFENKVAEYEVASLTGEWVYEKALQFRVYSKDGCPFCDKVKTELYLRGEKFEVVDLTNDDARFQFYAERGLSVEAGTATVPQVYLVSDDGQETLIGGWGATFNYLEERDASYMIEEVKEEDKGLDEIVEEAEVLAVNDGMEYLSDGSFRPEGSLFCTSKEGCL